MPNVDKAYGALKMISINIYDDNKELKNIDIVFDELRIVWDSLEQRQRDVINEIFGE